MQNQYEFRFFPFKGVSLEIFIPATTEILDIQTREKFKKHQ